MAGLISTEITAHGASHVSVLGDSAGGTLALASVEYLVANNQAVPASMVLLSPWLDVSDTNPNIAYVHDPILPPLGSGAQNIGKVWAGNLPENNYEVSPLYGSLKGLPPTYVYSGSLDEVSPDALVLEQEAVAQGAPISFALVNGRNPRLDFTHPGRVALLAADRPGTRCLKTRCWKSARRQKRAKQRDCSDV
jgi:triacylglycerol lipase